MDMKSKIQERNLSPHEVGVAALIAGFHEMGLLNQAAVFKATQRAGRALAEYADAKDHSPKDPLEAVKLLHRLTPLAVEIEFREEGDKVVIVINTNTCKYCPKGVGGAVLEGTLCPYPGLILGFLSHFFPNAELVFVDRKPLLKEGDFCRITVRRP